MSDFLLELIIYSARTPNLNQRNAAQRLLEVARMIETHYGHLVQKAAKERIALVEIV